MPKILVIYHSETGNTEAAARLVAEGAGEGAEVVSAVDVKIDDVVAADAVAIGSPDYFSYMSGYIKVFFDRAYHVRDQLAGKPCAVFLTHGGGGKGMEPLEKIARSIKLDLVAGGLSILNAPEGDSAEACRDLGRKLAEAASGN